MEFKQLEAFVHVAEQNSFSKAAKKLYLTQPTISAHIASLENELNAELITRNTKEVSISKQGEKLYIYAKEILSIREETLKEFLGNETEKTVIHLAASTMPSRYILPEILAAYGKSNPSSHFTIERGDSAQVIRKVQNQQVEIGLVGTCSEDSRLHFRPFFEDRLVMVLPNQPMYQELIQQHCPLPDLLQYPLILRESGSGTRKEAERFLQAQGVDLNHLNIVANINDQEIIKKSVSEGLGISIMSEKAAEDFVAYGSILSLDIEGYSSNRKLYLVHCQNKRLSKQGKKFIEFVQHFYEEERL